MGLEQPPKLEDTRPVPVVHITPRYSETMMVDPRAEHLWSVEPGGKLMLAVCDDQGRKHLFSLPFRGEGEPEFGPIDGRLIAFGAHKLSDTVWAIYPSVMVPGVLHAYVTLCDAPSPPPWAPKVILSP